MEALEEKLGPFEALVVNALTLCDEKDKSDKNAGAKLTFDTMLKMRLENLANKGLCFVWVPSEFQTPAEPFRWCPHF